MEYRKQRSLDEYIERLERPAARLDRGDFYHIRLLLIELQRRRQREAAMVADVKVAARRPVAVTAGGGIFSVPVEMAGESYPYVPHSDTSRKAAREMKGKGPVLRVKVYRYLQSRGPAGATDDEIEAALEMRHQTVSARRRELVQRGLAQDSGQRRKTSSGRTATVWTVTIQDTGGAV